jgi:S-adenosylmethionine:tRNA ribosyltransferase-isomerase
VEESRLANESSMRLSDFDYPLPDELIAQHPPTQRGQSRLLHLDGANGALFDRQFTDLLELVNPNDVLVFNDTKVIKARLIGRKQSGGRIEVLVERVLDAHHALVQVRASHRPKPGARLTLADSFSAMVLDDQNDLLRLHFESDASVFELLERYGALPLPPYIAHVPDSLDEARYQTVYAKLPGAVAAPTAGLHFDQAMLRRLDERGVRMAYVTLHVGAGTFQPVRVEDLAEHRMHSEWYRIPQDSVTAIEAARAAGGRVLAVGTTSLRALEAAAVGGKLTASIGETNLFITPGFRFSVVDRLLTNFHLPKSTLLMLVCAFGGTENIRIAYRHAIAKRYRFFSYGDAMLIERQGREPRG